MGTVGEVVKIVAGFAIVTTVTILADRLLSDKAAIVVLVISLVVFGLFSQQEINKLLEWSRDNRQIAITGCVIVFALLGLAVGLLITRKVSESGPANAEKRDKTNPAPPPTVLAPAKTGAIQTRFAYPLISNGMLFGNMVTLICSVHDWPTTTDDLRRGKGSLESLFHLTGDISRIDSWIGEAQTEGHTVMHIDSAEWNNNDAPFKASGRILLDRDNTVFTYHLGARNAGWGGYLILSKNGDKLDIEQGISGTVESEQKQEQHMKITIFTRWKDGRYTVTSRHEYNAPSNERLRELGIPEFKRPS